ncbi:MAG: response regulator, partial [Deltaproteobacteria bacterium]|nr:response regulator [Deltaproteobacteria bacterium]
MPNKILIVDDEPSIIVPVQFLMEQNGYDVMVAFSGEEAMEIIADKKVDLILLD